LSSKAWSSLAAPADVATNSAALHTAASATEENTHVDLRITAFE
jgi:hypothetical protein